MEAGIFVATNEMLPADRLHATRWPRLSIGEFLQLGLYRVAYLTRVQGHEGTVDLVLHSADGMAVAVVDAAGMAADLADQLGLMLVPVH